jgi:hypothetical protein
MVNYYTPGWYPGRYKPVVLPDIRLHLGLWRKFRSKAGNWPRTSIVLFSCRFAFVAIGLAIVLLFFLRHHVAVSPMRAVILSALLVFGVVWGISAVFAFEQSVRYAGVILMVVLSIIGFCTGDFGRGYWTLRLLQIFAFAAIWGLVERWEWNRQLRAAGISSNQEVWAVTQFPQNH